MPRIVMLLGNPCINDTRVQKEAFSLAGAGYEVVVLCDSSGVAIGDETRHGVTFCRRNLRIKTKPGQQKGQGAMKEASRSRDRSAPPDAFYVRGKMALIRALDAVAFGAASLLVRRRQIARLTKGLNEQLSALPAQFIHAHDLETLPAAVLAADRCAAAVVYDAHELEGERHGMRWLERWWSQRLEGRLIRRAARVITVSQAIADLLMSRYGIAPPAVVLNAPDLAMQEAGAGDLRDHLGLDQATRLAVYIGKLGPHRGLETCLDSLRLLPDLHFACVGPVASQFSNKLQGIAAAHHVSARFHIVDAVPPQQLLGFIAAADVAVVPTEDAGLSYRYSLPNKLFEATFAGLPVCVSDLPEQRRFVETVGNGLVADMSRPAALAEALREVLADPTRFRLQADALARLADDFAWSAQAQRLIALYRSLAASKHEQADVAAP